jgi:hypothetical protein
MRVRITDHVLLVAPLRPGEDLKGGDEVDAPENLAREWIRRGLAAEITEERSVVR